MQTEADNPGVLVFPPLLYGAALLVVIALRWFWPLRIPAHDAVFWLGTALLAAGIGVAVWGKKTMDRAGTNVNPRRPTTAIVTGGPFRYTRNPLYLAITMILLGISFVIDTWWGIIVIVPVLLIMHFGVVRREERYLEQKFGENYLQYKRAVRRYL